MTVNIRGPEIGRLQRLAQLKPTGATSARQHARRDAARAAMAALREIGRARTPAGRRHQMGIFQRRAQQALDTDR